jgi:hypothetical protein
MFSQGAGQATRSGLQPGPPTVPALARLGLKRYSDIGGRQIAPGLEGVSRRFGIGGGDPVTSAALWSINALSSFARMVFADPCSPAYGQQRIGTTGP